MTIYYDTFDNLMAHRARIEKELAFQTGRNFKHLQWEHVSFILMSYMNFYENYKKEIPSDIKDTPFYIEAVKGMIRFNWHNERIPSIVMREHDTRLAWINKDPFKGYCRHWNNYSSLSEVFNVFKKDVFKSVENHDEKLAA